MPLYELKEEEAHYFPVDVTILNGPGDSFPGCVSYCSPRHVRLILGTGK